MPWWYDSRYLGGQIELTEERSRHIAFEHGDLAPFLHRISEVVGDPDTVRRSRHDPRALLFSRWYDDIEQGKHVIVVVVSDEGAIPRHWIITAYITARLAGGAFEWQRS